MGVSSWAALHRTGSWEHWETPGWGMIQVFLPSLPSALPYPQGNWPVAVVQWGENDEQHGKKMYLKVLENLELIILQGGTDKSVANNECSREVMS